MIWVSKGLLTLIWYPDCYAATQLPQSSKYSKSADLLRKSLLSHIWRVPSSKALSCKHEQLFDLLTLVSYDVGVKRSFAPNWCLRIAPLQSSSRNSINIRNPLIYWVNRCFLMFGGSQVQKPYHASMNGFLTFWPWHHHIMKIKCSAVFCGAFEVSGMQTLKQRLSRKCRR